jgi:hypothetical protein
MAAKKGTGEETQKISLSRQVEKTRTRAKSYVMDLRVQSPASRGYLGVEGLDSAPAMVRLAKVKGLDVIAISDFYSGEFIDRVVEAASSSPLTVIPGVSVRCQVKACSEVIISCLFPETTTSGDVEGFLRSLNVPREAKGNPDYVVRKTLDEVLSAIGAFNGEAISSRIDKTPHRMTVLPELVEVYGFRAFDLTFLDSAVGIKKRWPKIPFQFFSFSDANALAQIGSRIAKVKLSTPGFAGIREILARH